MESDPIEFIAFFVCTVTIQIEPRNKEREASL